MTASQLADFETFFDTTTAGGSLEWQWYDFSKNPKVSAQFTFGDATPDISALVGQSATQDSYWRVSFQVEMRS
jgi:hypothetical protein